jgi:hypothetical protein
MFIKTIKNAIIYGFIVLPFIIRINLQNRFKISLILKKICWKQLFFKTLGKIHFFSVRRSNIFSTLVLS